jgi:hypothetical protein
MLKHKHATHLSNMNKNLNWQAAKISAKLYIRNQKCTTATKFSDFEVFKTPLATKYAQEIHKMEAIDYTSKCIP